MIDTERVILEVQTHPVLWDMKNELYKDRDARQKAWLEVCGTLLENFADLSDKDKKTKKKNTSTLEISKGLLPKDKSQQQKLKSGSCATKARKYAYYDMMTFLESNCSNESQESLAEDENASNISTLSGSSSQGNEISTPGTSSQDTEIATPITSKRSRKSNSPTPFERELLNSIKQRRDEENDEDMAFFTSIMPTLKKFNPYQKLLFRTKIMEYLIDIEKQKVLEIDNLTFTTDLFTNTSQS